MNGKYYIAFKLSLLLIHEEGLHLKMAQVRTIYIERS